MYHISESRHVSSLKRKIVLLFKIKVHVYSVMHPIPRPLDKTGLRLSTIWSTNQSILNFAANCLFYFLSWHVAFSAKKSIRILRGGDIEVFYPSNGAGCELMCIETENTTLLVFLVSYIAFLFHTPRVCLNTKVIGYQLRFPFRFDFSHLCRVVGGVQFFFQNMDLRMTMKPEKEFEYLFC